MASNLELVQGFVAAFRGIDFRRLRDIMESGPATAEEKLGAFGVLHAKLIDPEIELDLSGIEHFSVLLPPSGCGRGVAAWAEFWRNWFEAWETNEVEHRGWEAADDWVIAEVSSRLSGRASGAEVEFSNFQLWRLRGGRVVAYSVHPTREAALAAAGADA
jgi:ketosteroid isomerase-like protein